VPRVWRARPGRSGTRALQSGGKWSERRSGAAAGRPVARPTGGEVKLAIGQICYVRLL